MGCGDVWKVRWYSIMRWDRIVLCFVGGYVARLGVLVFNFFYFFYQKKSSPKMTISAIESQGEQMLNLIINLSSLKI